MNLPYPGAVLPSADDTPSLPEYEGDFALWLRAQAELLHERKFELLDVENLAEEVDSMGRSLHRELKSRLNVILVHPLKVKYRNCSIAITYPELNLGRFSERTCRQRKPNRRG